ncbi:MAG: hypothetical protein JSU07_11005 [Bacteroidetes bacterium]|nr:hypothetical protein [Bacteroidota bacterium]
MKCTDEAMEQVKNKLYPKSKGGITGVTPGIIFESKKNKTKVRFYENSDEIPLERNIFCKDQMNKVIIKKIE